MGGGCLPMLIQLPIMMGVYSVNYKILSYVLRIEEGTLNAIKDVGKTLQAYKDLIPKSGNTDTANYRLESIIIEHFGEIKGKLSGIEPEIINEVEEFIDKFHFLGMDLSQQPNFKEFNILWLIPILTGIVSFAMALYSFFRQRKTNPEMAKNPSMGCMSLMTPAMSIWFSFMFPASVGLYIIISTALSFIQMVVLNQIYSPKKVLAKDMVDETINRRAREKLLKKVSEKKNED